MVKAPRLSGARKKRLLVERGFQALVELEQQAKILGLRGAPNCVPFLL